MEVTNSENEAEAITEEGGRHRSLSVSWKILLITATVLVVGLATNQLFNLGFFVGHIWLDNKYQYALFGLLVPLSFIIFPFSDKANQKQVPWYDIVAAAGMFGLLVYYFMNAELILDSGWEMGAPMHIVVLAVILWALVLEATRRADGTALFVIVFLISLYPLFADVMPGPISGLSSSWQDTMAYHALSAESMLGIPMQALANLVIGILLFGVALTQTCF